MRKQTCPTYLFNMTTFDYSIMRWMAVAASPSVFLSTSVFFYPCAQLIGQLKQDSNQALGPKTMHLSSVKDSIVLPMEYPYKSLLVV